MRYKFGILPYLPVKTALRLVRYECRLLLHSPLQLICGKACFGVQVLDIMNGAFCNLCVLALGLALHIFTTQC